MKTTRKTIFLSIVVVSLLAVSSSAAFANVSGSEDGGDAPIAPKSADTIPDFADEDSIVDPRGQSVKESADLDLSREMTVDVVNPIDWELEVDGFEVIDAEIPMNLDLNLGMGFPLKAETSYDPYDVHKGESFTYVVDVDNEDCTPYADLGVDFSMDFADLNFQLFESSNLLEFSTDWGSIDYSESVTIPFYGTTTEFGDWINYDIVDEYYSIDDILSLAGANVKLSDYGLKGGVGVNVNYRLHSWVTADMSVMNQTGDVVQSETLNWQDIGAKEVSVSIDSDAIHGEYYSIDVGDWVYHVAHDVTFTVWADVGLDVF